MDADQVVERVAKIESELRRARSWNRLAALGALALVSTSVGGTSEDSLRLRRLEIVDESGRTLIELASRDGGGRIDFLDPRVLAAREIVVSGVIDERDGEASLQATPVSVPAREGPVTIELRDGNGQILLRSREGRETLLSANPYNSLIGR